MRSPTVLWTHIFFCFMFTEKRTENNNQYNWRLKNTFKSRSFRNRLTLKTHPFIRWTVENGGFGKRWSRWETWKDEKRACTKISCYVLSEIKAVTVDFKHIGRYWSLKEMDTIRGGDLLIFFFSCISDTCSTLEASQQVLGSSIFSCASL